MSALAHTCVLMHVHVRVRISTHMCTCPHVSAGSHGREHAGAHMHLRVSACALCVSAFTGTCADVYTHVCAHVPSHMHTRARLLVCTCLMCDAHAHAHVCACMCVCVRMCTGVGVRAHVQHICVHVHVFMCACAHACLHVCMCVRVHVHARARMCVCGVSTSSPPSLGEPAGLTGRPPSVPPAGLVQFPTRGASALGTCCGEGRGPRRLWAPGVGGALPREMEAAGQVWGWRSPCLPAPRPPSVLPEG